MALGLELPEACGIFPDQGSNPCTLHWQVDAYPLYLQGSSQKLSFWWLFASELFFSCLLDIVNFLPIPFGCWRGGMFISFFWLICTCLTEKDISLFIVFSVSSDVCPFAH